MVILSWTDYSVITIFFVVVFLIGFISSRKVTADSESYLLSGRNLGIFLFIMTNVATWYGGILGVGEFTYRYGLVSWFTQGFPYYIFAILFAFFLAPRIREASLFTIPDKITQSYGKGAGIISAAFIFVLVSPAPYLLMIGTLLQLVTGVGLLTSILIGAVLSSIYLFTGGYRSDVFTDAFEFFVMFGGFILLIVALVSTYGGIDYLSNNLPENHLNFTGNTSPVFIIVWFLIALWTFTDPGFHQRSYAARSPNVAKYGILISVSLWMLFDFLTTTGGLYSRAALPELENPVIAFPMLADRVLPSGLRGIFYAALAATIISTLQSYLFLSATTFSRDLVQTIFPLPDRELKKYTQFGLGISILLGIIIAALLPSVIDIWYTLGSLVIPVLIFAVIGAYYPRVSVPGKVIILEMITSTTLSGLWIIMKSSVILGFWAADLEPMIIGLSVSFIIHLAGLVKRKNKLR